jgi:rod shape determining protein RodA
MNSVSGFSRNLERRTPTLAARVLGIKWGLVLLASVVAGIGVMALYSAADGNMQPWASKQMIRFAIALLPMLAATLLNIRRWFAIAYSTYCIALLLVFAVDLRGVIGMGAQRWIDLGIIQLQPSELMSAAMMLALARFFHCLGEEDTGKLRYLIVPTLMIIIPVALVLKQPDLGTAVLLLVGGLVMLFIAGLPLRMFAFATVIGAIVLPLVWRLLRPYQKSRIYTFLDPDSDPLGAGYHILQSKIALGSGGLLGKGFLRGTQSHLNFLPAKQTDFIFTTLAEEFGLVGGIVLIILYVAMIIYGYAIALRSRSQFGRLLGLGIINNFFLYVFINIAMVAGLIPVVGVPLPLISFGGTAMLTVMFGFGLLMSVYVDRDVQLNRIGEVQPD